METPKIKLGFRGEDIDYTVRNQSTWIGFTSCKGERIYSDSIKKWNDTGESLSQQDKVSILKDVIRFVRKPWWSWAKPIIVINMDDPDRDLWEQVCKLEMRSIKRIEYTSNQEQKNFARQMWLEVLQKQRILMMNGTRITNESELDDYLRRTDSST